MRRKVAILALAFLLLLTPITALQHERDDREYDTAIVDPTLTLVSPDGDESWSVGTGQYINWTSVGSLGNVKLEYSKDNFSSDVNTIVVSTTNNGSYLWTVANDPSTSVKVRVSFVDDSAINDLSNASFSITCAPSSLLAWWRFDESSGTTADDSQGDHDGTLYNSPTWYSHGVLNNSLYFPQSNDYVRVSDHDDLDIDDDSYSFAIWARSSSSGTQTLFVKSDNSDGYSIAFSNNDVIFALRDESTNYAITADSEDYTDDDWHHIVGVVDRSTDLLRLYIDGESAATPVDISDVGIIDNSYQLEIGAVNSGSNDLQGYLDEFRVYTGAMTTDEVETLYESYTSQFTVTTPNGGENWTVAAQQTLTWTASGPIENVKLEYSKDNFASDITTIVASTANNGSYTWTVPGDPSTTVRVRVSDADNSSLNDVSDGDFIIYDPPGPDLRHWWKFDETGGTNAEDSEGDTDGELKNGATWNTSGKLNGALDLDGGNDFVEVDDDDTLDVGADESVSFAIWFKAEDEGQRQHLFYKRSGNPYYYLRLDPDGKLKVEIKDTQKDRENLKTSSAYDDGYWHHAVVVINRTNDMMYLYVDGDLKNSGSISDVDSLVNSDDLSIGADHNGYNNFGGLLDEFRFYDVALIATEVSDLYDSY